MIASVLGIEKEQVRVVSRDVGGSFGAKARPSPEEALLGWISKRVGRPVVWIPSRSDDMVGLGHGRGQVQYCRIGGTADGDITAYHLHVVQESGAYPAGGAGLPAQGRPGGAHLRRGMRQGQAVHHGANAGGRVGHL